MSEIVDSGAVGFGGSCNTWFPRILRHGGFAGSGWTHAGVGCGVVRCCDGIVLIESRQHPIISMGRVVSKDSCWRTTRLHVP